jgi:hypothetical protein
MAGGQSASFGQGSVSEVTTVALAGSAITGTSGDVTVPSLPVDVAATGSEAVLAAGSVANNVHFIRLRSRKSGSGTATFELAGLSFPSGVGTAAVAHVSPISGQAILSLQGSFGKTRTRALGGTQVVIAQTNVISGSTQPWTIGDITFVQGVPLDVQLSVPSNYLLGGTFDVVGSLPNGVTMTPGGLVQYNGSGLPTSVVVQFGYTEPAQTGALPVLTVYPNNSGTYPYMASVFPLEGAVPAGKFLVSPNDSTLRSSTISTYPDGSARVMVVAGTKAMTATVEQTLNLAVSTNEAAGTPLTTAAIAARFTSGITVNFPPNSSGPQTLSNFSNPHRIWWANSQVICARYRLPCGLGVMEAQIDVHAFATGHTFVEIVVENGQINTALATPPTLPGPSRMYYTGATFVINGTNVATVNMPAGGSYFTTNTHEKFRAYYVGAWMNQANIATPIRGTSDPFVEVTHDVTHMQAHPIWPGKHARAKTHNPTLPQSNDQGYARPGVATINQAYTNDFYQPWDIGRYRPTSMGSSGLISQLIWEEWRYVQGPDRHTRRAVLATSLGYLSYYINYRDANGDVPSFTQLNGRFRNTYGYLPYETGVQPDYAINHTGSQGLMGFLCQPSPCFIELMQKKCVWDGTQQSSTPILYSAQAGGGARCWAWYIRHLNHAIFATPDGHPWKASGENALYQQLYHLDAFRRNGNCKLNVLSFESPTRQTDQRPTTQNGSPNTGGTLQFEVAFWQHTWIVAEVYKGHNSKILSDATRRADHKVFNDWLLTGAIRMVNEQAHTGGWRYQNQYQVIGSRGAEETNCDGIADGLYPYWNGSDFGSYETWDLMAQGFYSDYPPPEGPAGNWMDNPNTSAATGALMGTYASHSPVTLSGGASGSYCEGVWPWMVYAVESDLPGAAQMWTTMRANLPNLGTYINGWAFYVENGVWPRNKPLDI